MTTVEYGILAAGVGILAIGGLLAVRDSAQSNYQSTTAGTGVCIGSGCNAYDTLPAAAIPAPGTLTLAGYSSISATRNVAILSQAPVVSGGSAPYTYAITPAAPAGLAFSNSTGVLSGTPTTVQALTPYVITVTDSAGATATQGINITVTAPSLSLSGYSSINGTAGVAIADQSPSPSGGTAPYSYSVNPALPSGLTLNSSSGLLSGSPASAQSSAGYTITVTDGSGSTATQTITITVAAPLTLSGYSNISGTTGVAITAQTPSPGGGTAGYSYGISPSVPAGLTFNASTGVLSGTPTTFQNSTAYTVTVTDSLGVTATQTFTIALSNPTCTAGQILVNGACTATPPITICYEMKKNTNNVDFNAFTGYSYNTGGYTAALASVTGGTQQSSSLIRRSLPNNNDLITITFTFNVTYPSNGSTATTTSAASGTMRIYPQNGQPNSPTVITCP